MKYKIRVALTISLVAFTVAYFAYYIDHHRLLLTQLGHTPLRIVIYLIALYFCWILALAIILHSSLILCRTKIDFRENMLLNAYSSLVNFFVPGQGGIAVRALYLKRLRNLKARNFILATLLYYACYALISCLLLLVDNRPWWQTLLASLAVILGSLGLIFIYANRSKLHRSEFDLTPRSIGYLAAATLFQAAIQVSIYGTELHQVNHHISFSQMVTYTGAANFSLFVSLTPGAIGIRESFLLFSRRLHHISEANIVSANVIDRGVFLVVLGLMFLATIIFHAKYRNLKDTLQAEKPQKTKLDNSSMPSAN